MRIQLNQLIGKAFNLFGIPGLVRRGSYTAPISRVSVKVERSELFTVVSVDGVDVYLNRITGEIVGVGFNASAGQGPAGFLELQNAGGLRETLSSAAYKGRRLDHVV